MKTVVINIDDESSVKLFLELAKKFRFRARVLNEEQKEDMALLAMMKERDKEEPLPVKSAYTILKKVK